MAVFKQPDSCCKVWRGSIHVGSITNTLCCSKMNDIGSSLTLVGEDRGV